MARSKGLNNVAVVFTALIGILNQQRDGCSRGQALVNTRQNLHGVGFVSLGDEFGCARPPAIKVRLNVSLRQRHARWAPVNHTANGWAVGFTKIGDRK